MQEPLYWQKFRSFLTENSHAEKDHEDMESPEHEASETPEQEKAEHLKEAVSKTAKVTEVFDVDGREKTFTFTLEVDKRGELAIKDIKLSGQDLSHDDFLDMIDTDMDDVMSILSDTPEAASIMKSSSDSSSKSWEDDDSAAYKPNKNLDYELGLYGDDEEDDLNEDRGYGDYEIDDTEEMSLDAAGEPKYILWSSPTKDLVVVTKGGTRLKVGISYIEYKTRFIDDVRDHDNPWGGETVIEDIDLSTAHYMFIDLEGNVIEENPDFGKPGNDDTLESISEVAFEDLGRLFDDRNAGKIEQCTLDYINDTIV